MTEGLDKNGVNYFWSKIKGYVSSNEELIAFMVHPRVSIEEKEEVLKNIFSGKVSGEMYSLMHMILIKGHFSYILKVMDYYIDRSKEYKNIGVVYVSTPAKLGEDKKQVVEQKLLDTTDYVSLEMHYSIDEALIGGMVIRIGDRVVDSSIRTKLDRLKNSLSSVR